MHKCMLSYTHMHTYIHAYKQTFSQSYVHDHVLEADRCATSILRGPVSIRFVPQFKADAT